jgi:hypothetical protein
MQQVHEPVDQGHDPFHGWHPSEQLVDVMSRVDLVRRKRGKRQDVPQITRCSCEWRLDLKGAA